MAVSLAPQAGSFRTPQRQNTQPVVYPAPLNGMDARVPLAVESLNTCIWAVNILPTEYAMRVRNGYREWAIGLANEGRTVIPYIGRNGDGTDDRLFVATTDGIYDVSTEDTAPVLKVAFSTQSADSGFGVFTSYVDESGDDLMFYADQENGLFRYDPATETWATATGITTDASAIGTLNVAKIVYVVVHKLRVWLVEKNANKAWYLPIRSAQGAAKEFFFASKFQYGGELVGLYNWTVDGGAGRDDHLVAISRGGDVIPYTGEDPADATTWTSTGTFSVGPIPEGHKIAAEYGGELFVLSRFGIIMMSSLLRGATLSDPMANVVGHKIARLLRADLEIYGLNKGWAIQFIPSIGSIVIQMPVRGDARYRQYVYNLSTQGWGLWRDVPMLASAPFQGDLHFTDVNGRLLRMDQSRDNILLDGADPNAIGEPIDWFLLTSYSYLDAPGAYKRAKFVRCNFVAETEPFFNASVHFDYRTDQPNPNTNTPEYTAGTDLWDFGLWGEALWSVDILNPFNEVLGSSGIGRAAAVAINGQSVTTTDMVSVEVMWDTGGLL